MITPGNSDNVLATNLVNVRLSELVENGMNLDEWLHNLTKDIDLTDAQRTQLSEALKKTMSGTQVQVFGGNQNIGHQQLIFQDESMSKLAATLASLAVTIRENFGEERGAKIIEVAVMAFVSALAKNS